jgi:hypothetical protein
MNGGLFITLYDDRTLALYLKYGIYGFLMPPIMTPKPSPYSRHYCVLADYACSRQGTHIFFFLAENCLRGSCKRECRYRLFLSKRKNKSLRARGKRLNYFGTKASGILQPNKQAYSKLGVKTGSTFCTAI